MGAINRTDIKSGGWIIAGALILMLHAFVNGYPIVYSDTSTYLASGFELETPFDRPITYGIFLWITSFGGMTLWGPVFFQTLVLSLLIFRLMAFFFEGQRRGLIFIGSAVVLSVFTGLSWVTSQLIADVFTPIMVLSLILILIGRNSLRETLGLYAIFTISVAMHMAHISIGVVLILLMALYFILTKANDLKPLLTKLSVALVLTIASIFTMGSAMSKSKHAFLFAAMVEHDIVETYLDEHCDDHDYAICAYKDRLPEKAWVFLWDVSSPFYAMGDFKGTKEEFNAIIYATLTSPKYLGLHLKASLEATFDQLLRFDMGDGNGEFLEGTLLYERIAHYVPHELKAYKNSRQNKKEMGYVGVFNTIQWLFISASSVFVIVLLIFRWRRIDIALRHLIVFMLLAVAVNAWASGTFANAIDRLGVKMVWVVALLAMISVACDLQTRRKSSN